MAELINPREHPSFPFPAPYAGYQGKRKKDRKTDRQKGREEGLKERRRHEDRKKGRNMTERR